MPYTKNLIDRFFSYVHISSQSDASNKTLPSSQGQFELACLLKKELQALGLSQIKLQDNAILSAILKANANKPSIGFCAHLDTVNVGLSPHIKPQILKFCGQDLILNQEKNIICSPKDHPELLDYLHEEIIFSDGTSVLGADNKAAIAIIMTLLEAMLHEPHGDIWVCFVPDEEIGLRGSKALSLEDFCPTFAYTIDCCQRGELVFETFYASQACIKIKGVTAHPMNAKGILVNPTLIALDIANCFDRLKTPENTEGYEGYIWINAIHSNQAKATMQLSIRDHDQNKYQSKQNYIKEVIALMQKKHPRAQITVEIEELYTNIKESINQDNKQALTLVKQAFKACQIEPKIFPMRGGTDGSALSQKGLFVPNFFTGAHNFHSAFEFLPISSFYQSFEVAKKIIELS